jgi:hypothetical protein
MATWSQYGDIRLCLAFAMQGLKSLRLGNSEAVEMTPQAETLFDILTDPLWGSIRTAWSSKPLLDIKAVEHSFDFKKH